MKLNYSTLTFTYITSKWKFDSFFKSEFGNLIKWIMSVTKELELWQKLSSMLTPKKQFLLISLENVSHISFFVLTHSNLLSIYNWFGYWFSIWINLFSVGFLKIIQYTLLKSTVFPIANQGQFCHKACPCMWMSYFGLCCYTGLCFSLYASVI